MFQTVYVVQSHVYSIYDHLLDKEDDDILGGGYRVFSTRRKARKAMQKTIMGNIIYNTGLNREYEVKKINDYRYETITDDVVCRLKTIYEVEKKRKYLKV